MLPKNNIRILIAACAGIVACVGDFAVLFILGTFYPGYNQLKDTMSSLGASVSPISNLISIWWIILGFLFVIFGLGFRLSFDTKSKNAALASWSIIIYGIGEGIGSGAFKADRIHNALTLSATVHDFLGGIGIIFILVLPLLMLRIIPKSQNQSFRTISWIVFITGTISLILFTCRFLPDTTNFITTHKGLWQRVFMAIIYTYLVLIAIRMIRTRKNPLYS
jgi:hypothetical protein